MGYLILGVPVLLALASWWAWATLFSNRRRWRDLPVLVVPALYGFGLWSLIFNDYPTGEWLFQLGWISGPVLAGLALTFAVRRLMRLEQRERLAAGWSALVSLGVLVTMLALFWAAGSDVRERGEDGWAAALLQAPTRPARGQAEQAYYADYTSWVRATVGLSYAGALLLSVALAWVGTGRGRRIGPAPAVSASIVSAAMVATFFYPVEFFNSCYAETVFRYTLC